MRAIAATVIVASSLCGWSTGSSTGSGGRPVEYRSRQSTAVGNVLAGATAGTAHTWRVGHAQVRVVCPLTVGGSFNATTAALTGSLTTGVSGARVFDGRLAVDLRTLDTGIGLRNEHLRENYLEVDKGAGFDTATLSEIDLHGLDPDSPTGKGSFTGVLTLHDVTKTVAGAVEVRQAGGALRAKASFPVHLPDFGIRKPRYLGVGVTDTVRVEVAFDVSR